MSTTAPSSSQLPLSEYRCKLMVPANAEELRHLPLFSTISESFRDRFLEKIRKHLHWVKFRDNEILIREGSYNDSAFYIAEGSVELLSEGFDEGTTKLARLHPRANDRSPTGSKTSLPPDMLGRATTTTELARSKSPKHSRLAARDIFGEESALSRYQVAATARAVGSVKILQIRLPGLRLLMAASPEFRRELDARYRERALSEHLGQVKLLAGVPPELIEWLKERAKLLFFEPGELIVKEGDSATDFYLVRGGHVKVSLRSGTSELAVTYLRRGDHAGEVALLLEEHWPVSLRALEHVEMVKLSRDDFQELLNSYPDIRDRLWADVASRLKARGAAARNPISSEYMQMAIQTGLIHGESVLLLDLSTCTRCDDCVRGCASVHDGEPRFIREGPKYRHWLIPTACYQCTDPVCMVQCPTGAITREAGSLEVTINASTCIGCSNCAERCPWDNIVMVDRADDDAAVSNGRPPELATKCDLCVTRPEGPACVQMCPQDSAIRISFKNDEQVRETLAPEPALLRPKKPKNLVATGIAAVAMLAFYWAASSVSSGVPGRGLGLAFGGLAAFLFVFEMLYAGRRRQRALFKNAHAFLQAHVYLGGLALVAMLIHTGFRQPSGAVGWWLWGLSFWTVATGLLGVFLQKWIPAALADGLRIEPIYETIPELSERLRADADILMENAGDALGRFYDSEVRPSLEKVKASSAYLFNVRAGSDRALAPFIRLREFLDPEEARKLEELIHIYEEKLELDAHYTLQRALRLWPLVHVPPAGLLIGFLTVHIFSWLWY